MIEVKGITKQYGKKVVLRDATFSAKQGECVAIAGANGSGKSTLLKTSNRSSMRTASRVKNCRSKNTTLEATLVT